MRNIFLTINLILIIFGGQISFATICVNKSVIPPLNAGTIFHGQKIAFHDMHFNDYEKFYSDNNLAFSKKMKKMNQQDCSVILGLVASNECLIAGPSLMKKKMIAISPRCEHNGLNAFYPYLFVASPPLSAEVAAMSNYIHNHHLQNQLFVFYQSTSVYSNEMFRQFKKVYRGEYITVNIDSDNQFDLTKLISIKSSPSTILFLTYPLPSVKALVKLSNSHLINKKLVIIGGSSWEDGVNLFKPIESILKSAKKNICVEMVNRQAIRHTRFYHDFYKTYGRKPLDIEAISYDITKFTVICYRQAVHHQKFNRKLFQRCITHKKYRGITGNFEFNRRSSFSIRPIYFINFLSRFKS